MKIILVAGARPNYMKIAPLVAAIKKHNLRKGSQKNKIEHVLVHTGQHYDKEMSEFFFEDLRLPEPDIHLGIGSGTHADQTARIMMAFEKVCLKERPDLVIVVGDVNSTLACALVAAKLLIPVAHVEAGLRSFDRSMPEEINRLVTDQLSDFLFTTDADANRNLLKEGISPNKVCFVGNVMIDTLLAFRKLAQGSKILEKLHLQKDRHIKKYGVVTLHRPSNVDNFHVLEGILAALSEISRDMPIIFPAHPRTAKKIQEFGLENMVEYWEIRTADSHYRLDKKLVLLPPLGYLDFLRLLSRARLVLTDSGGIQDETTILAIPCLTLRGNTERPITIMQGTNTLVGSKPADIVRTAREVMRKGHKPTRIPDLWDGKASDRIIDILTKRPF